MRQLNRMSTIFFFSVIILISLLGTGCGDETIIVSEAPSQNKSISTESSSIIESYSVTESVQDESIEMSEEINESSLQESESKSSLSKKEKEDTSLSENYWEEQKIWDEQQDRFDKLEYFLEEHLKDSQYSSMRFLSENYS